MFRVNRYPFSRLVLEAEVALLLLIGCAMTVPLFLMAPLRVALLTTLVLTSLTALNAAQGMNSSLVLLLVSGLPVMAMLDFRAYWLGQRTTTGLQLVTQQQAGPSQARYKMHFRRTITPVQRSPENVRAGYLRFEAT